MKLESFTDAAEKATYEIVRTDYVNGGKVPGEIIMADEESGECSVCVAGETKSLNFGPNGIRIVKKR